MSRRIVIGLSVLVLCLGVAGCRELDQPGPAVGTAQLDRVEFIDAIPLEYGRFVGATPDVANPHSAVLWFAKPDETIVAVRVNVSRGLLAQQALTIPRK